MNKQTVQKGNKESPMSEGGHYADVDGLKMYYEIHGKKQMADQPPLVLLHGSLSATGTSFGKMLPALSKSRLVIAVEQQAHGHTADIDRPLSIRNMGEDTVALLRQLGVQKADFFGYSMGSGIAEYIAIHHPDIVGKLVLMGGVTYSREGFYPGLMEGIEGMQPDMLVGSPFHAEYIQIAPRPEDFPRMVERVKELDKNLPDWTADEIRSIQAPTLLIIGDSDIVRPEHVVEMFRFLGGGVVGDNVGLPNSRLAILPGTTHVSLVQRADWLVPMMSEFLA